MVRLHVSAATVSGLSGDSTNDGAASFPGVVSADAATALPKTRPSAAAQDTARTAVPRRLEYKRMFIPLGVTAHADSTNLREQGKSSKYDT
ncbi:hypothetical protein [Curtobacterium sp. VKM Ac-1376]|uniref:hypothetical protein n=1 Tax=Curtobacterium sp. VKM Ac-1376 TaxID=123312 RepID=UPI00188C2D44|nr:hypothetical protein [Curtobacterium sp. VKM Ac-1376]MBF4616079.1 hypothetical protein [Curtobacterium sp. VKM Ac-1376]